MEQFKSPTEIQMEISTRLTGRRYPAFASWFTYTFKDDIHEGAAYLAKSCQYDPPESMVWDYLAKTGDKTFSPNTFYKAAQIIFDEAAHSEILNTLERVVQKVHGPLDRLAPELKKAHRVIEKYKGILHE